MKVEKQQDGSWLASGDGYDRPILAEGHTRIQAEAGFLTEYGNQYAAAQVATHLALVESGQYE